MPYAAGGIRLRREALNSSCVDCKGKGYQQKLENVDTSPASRSYCPSSPSSPSSTSFDSLKSRCRIHPPARRAASTFWLLSSACAKPRFPRRCGCPRPPHASALTRTREMLGEGKGTFLRIRRRIRSRLAEVVILPHSDQSMRSARRTFLDCYVRGSVLGSL